MIRKHNSRRVQQVNSNSSKSRQESNEQNPKNNMKLFAFILLSLSVSVVAADLQESTSRVVRLARKADKDKHHDSHHSMMHSHLSRKVFDRACAANKDTIEEIITCITSNEHLTKTISPELAAGCHKEAFGIDFNPKDVMKHKELICNNRDKFEQLTTCIYKKTAEASDPKEMEKLTESMVDVGLCIINALDG